MGTKKNKKKAKGANEFVIPEENRLVLAVKSAELVGELSDILVSSSIEYMEEYQDNPLWPEMMLMAHARAVSVIISTLQDQASIYKGKDLYKYFTEDVLPFVYNLTAEDLVEEDKTYCHESN